MAQYRVNTPSFIHGRMYVAGDVINFDGVPGFNLEPMDDTAKKAKTSASKAASADVNKAEFALAMADSVSNGGKTGA